MEQAPGKVVVDFFQGRMHTDGPWRSLAQVLATLQAAGALPCHVAGSDGFEIRRLHGGGQPWRGEFAKIRQRDIPHAGAPGGAERDLEFAPHADGCDPAGVDLPATRHPGVALR